MVVEEAGLSTAVQDVPGRLGYWMVGVPPSGAMDDQSMLLANRIVGNQPQAAGLECTVAGPRLRFETDAVVAVTGADMTLTVDGRPAPMWEPLPVAAGAVLALGRLSGPGMRTYVAVRGGIDVPEVLGSRATFTLGNFGGFKGRELAAGDVLSTGSLVDHDRVPSSLRPSARPVFGSSWVLGVLEGPHAAPDFFRPEGIDELLAAEWTVQTHAARTGVRLSGPSPQWARPDGGEAGLHPSNIHDTGYAFGTVDFTGDTPVILGPDGPSLGGFTCPLTVISADRWKLGQLAPGNTVRFELLSLDDAAERRRRQAATRSLLRQAEASPGRPLAPVRSSLAGPVDGGRMRALEARRSGTDITFRRCGDEFLLIEFGAMTLDLELRARVLTLEQWLADQQLSGVVDLTAGIRSLLVHVDPDVLPIDRLASLVADQVEELPDPGDLVFPSRVVRLPLSWEDPSTLEAIDRYMNVVRDDAPWCPSNVEFIRRVNGLETIDEVRRIVFDASYLVMGLGDVYLGAPVATPLDPRHRLVTTKYNPARTWTPQNAVGIGGAYLCIYGMEGPGGYQFVGRTVPVWYLDGPTPGPDPETPWLLRHFDQIRFYPVDTDELSDLRAEASAGRLSIDITGTEISMADYRAELAANAASITEFRQRQQAAFEAEKSAWRASGELD
jgi:urea carboxylase